MTDQCTDDVEEAFIKPDRKIVMSGPSNVHFSIGEGGYVILDQSTSKVGFNKPGAHCLLTLLADHLGCTLTLKTEEG